MLKLIIMKAQTITKNIVASAGITSLALFSSCATMDPGYAAYKKQQQAQANAVANPYGAPAVDNNQYAVPGANGETGAPYQPIPGVPPVVENTPAPSQPYTPLPTLPPEPTQPSDTAATHTVEKGDTIWGLTRKYGVTGDALREANNLSTDVIWIGQRLIIPAR